MDVIIRIKDPILRCYLSSLFEKYEDGYCVNLNTWTGAAICAQVREAPKPELYSKEDKTLVRFIMPKSRFMDPLRGKFIYAPAEAQTLINSILKREFDYNFFTFCTELRMRGLKLKDIIPLFIYENKLDVFDGDIETLKKRYYRKEIEQLQKLTETLRQKVYFKLKKTLNSVDVHLKTS